jgi:UDPglucose--hexose-1-phosphate uridylyltransferase
MIQQEVQTGCRVVLDTPHFTAFCPYASRFPFETWILPRAHSSHFENIPKSAVDDLAGALKQVISRLEATLGRPPYNYIIHTAPFDHQEMAHYHWHIEIIPRLTQVAGFEWGTGFYINPVLPEAAAAYLLAGLTDIDLAGASDPRFGPLGRPDSPDPTEAAP